MKIPTYLALIGLSFWVNVAIAQTTTKKSKGTNKPVPASVTAPVKIEPVAPPPFSPVHWNSTLPPSAYAQNDAPKVYAWLEEKMKAVPGKIDQFSTKEEREQYAARVAEIMGAIPPIAFLTACNKKYNADRQAYEVKAPAFAIKDIMLKEPNPEALRLRKLRVGHREIKKETYTAQNAYGATTEVIRSVIDEFVLAYSAGAENEPSGLVTPGSTISVSLPYSYNFIFYSASVPMPPSEAREKQQEIACLSVFSLRAPYLFKYTERELPKRDYPYDSTTNGFALYGQLDRLQVVNKVSGDIYVNQARIGVQ